MMRRVRNLKKPADGGQHEQQDRVEADLVEGQSLAQVVDGVLQDPGPTGGDRRRHDHAHESSSKSTAISRQVLDQTTFRGHFRSIPARSRPPGGRYSASDRTPIDEACESDCSRPFCSAVTMAARAEAQFNVPDPAPGENFHVELGLMFWPPTPEIEIQTGGLADAGYRGRRLRSRVRAGWTSASWSSAP